MNTTRLLHRLGVILALLSVLLPAQEILQLDTLTVTAQGRVQPVGEVPIPLTAYIGSFLEQNGVSDYEALAPYVPGLFIQEQSPNNPGINIRGITTDSGDPRGESRVSIFQDGVSISRSRASVVELFDLERIEVLKGPQGTLFGRGAEIGAVSIVQRKAADERSGSLTVGFGSDREYRVAGHLNAPLVDGKLFGRLAFTHVQHDGTVENLADGSDLNGKHTTALRASLRWQPTTRTTADLIANWQHDTPPGTAFKSGVISTSRGDTDPFRAAELTRGSALGVDRTVGGLTGIITHELKPAWSVTSITGWREYDAYEAFDADGSGLYLLEFAEDARGRQLSQELRFNYDAGGRFAGFFGASWFRENGSARVPFSTDERQLWPFLSGSFASGLVQAGVPGALVNFAVPAMHPFMPQATLPPTFAAFANPALPPSLQGLAFLAGAPLQGRRTDEYTQSGQTRAFDVFADGTWRATDRLEITAGLRVTEEKLTSGYEVSNGSPSSTLGFILNAIPGYPYLPSGGKREATDSHSSWDGRVVVQYQVRPTLNAYASVSRGHRAPSLLVDSTTVTNAGEEEVWNYEAGSKGTLGNGRLQWSASVFQYDYAHFQTSLLSLGRFTVLDAGNATGRGFEFALQGVVNERLSVFATYAHTDATFDDTGDDGQPQAYAGNSFRLTPRNAFSIGGTLTLPAGSGRFFLTPTYQYKSTHWFEDNNASFGGRLRQDGFGLAHLRLGWRSAGDRWEVAIHATNLFDEEYLIDAGNVGGSFGIPTFVAGAPRRWGVQAGYRW